VRVNKLALVLVLSCLAYEVNAKETPAKITAEQSEAKLAEALDSMTEAESAEFQEKAEKLIKKMERLLEAHNSCMAGEGLEFQETKPAGWKLKAGDDSCSKNAEACTAQKIERARKECRERHKDLREELNGK